MSNSGLGPKKEETVGTLAVKLYENTQKMDKLGSEARALQIKRKSIEDDSNKMKRLMSRAIKETHGDLGLVTGPHTFTVVEGNELYYIDASGDVYVRVTKPVHIGEW